MKRGESSGRVDDNEETIKKRLQTFHEVTQPVIDYYDKQGKLRRVDSEKAPNDVFAEVQKILSGEDPDAKKKDADAKKDDSDAKKNDADAKKKEEALKKLKGKKVNILTLKFSRKEYFYRQYLDKFN
jgi:hypothetical protein